MRMNTQEAVLSAYIASIGKRMPRGAAQDAAELCRLANSLNRLNEIACNFGLTERQERWKQNLQTRIKAVLERVGLVLNHFESDARGYAGWRTHRCHGYVFFCLEEKFGGDVEAFAEPLDVILVQIALAAENFRDDAGRSEHADKVLLPKAVLVHQEMQNV